MWRSIFGKYKEIVAAIALFIVLDAGVLVLNFYTTYQISDDAHAIHLASRQSMLTQRIFHRVSQVHEDLINDVSIQKNVDELAVSFKQFDEVLDAFIYGGELIGAGLEQDNLLVDDEYSELSQKYLKEAEALWKPYRPLVSSLVYVDYDDEDFDATALINRSEKANAYAVEHGDKLLALVSEFSSAVENKAHEKAVELRTIQAIAITVAVINFFIILFHFIKRLSSSDELAFKSQGETKDILNTVTDGLFLLEPNYHIGSQYSASMKRLFRRDEFEGVIVFDVLAELVDKSTISIAKDYIDSLFNPRVKSSLMNDLNPLQEVSVTLPGRNGPSRNMFAFNFSRVYDGDVINHLLVSVKDVTERIDLRSQLERSKSKGQQDTESLLSLLNVDAFLLKEFLFTMDQQLVDINNELEKPAYNILTLVKKLENICRIVHSLKGESAMLGLHFVEEKAHYLEDKLALLKEKQELQGDDFLMITVQLNELVKSSDIIRAISSHAVVGQTMGETLNVQEPLSPLQKTLQSYSAETAQHYDKKVELDFSKFDAGIIPQYSMSTVKSVLAQLLRNAIVHGLENPKKRLDRGKNPVGLIKIETKKTDTMAILSIRDDGRGINFKAIKNSLLDEGQYSEEQIDQMTPKELVRFIFQSGFSTAKEIDQHAGRGVGLDVVKNALDKLGASLSVSCKAKVSTEFSIRIPLSSVQSLSQPLDCDLEKLPKIA